MTRFWYSTAHVKAAAIYMQWLFFRKPLALSPRVAVLTLVQSLRLQSGSTDAADVSFRKFIAMHSTRHFYISQYFLSSNLFALWQNKRLLNFLLETSVTVKYSLANFLYRLTIALRVLDTPQCFFISVKSFDWLRYIMKIGVERVG